MSNRTKNILIIILIAVGYYVATHYKSWQQLADNYQWQTTGITGQTENGKKQGEWRDYFINGKLAKLKNYRNDTLDGLSIGYTPKGEYQTYAKYKMGVKVDTFKMYAGGKLNLIEFRDSLGQLQGEFRVYTNGRLNQVGHYLDNKFNGDFLTYDIYKTGKLTEIAHYVKGEKKGKWIYLNTTGDTIRIEDYY
jgi:antitoxin component YwqK of YwqJK toxin-antitoxin module